MSTACTSVDYIVVGQGLAGSAVAAQLLLRKKRIIIIDESEQNSSSQVAVGLFNPLTGKRLARAWKAESVFPYLHAFYQKMERFTRVKFFMPMPLYRPLISVEEQNSWMAASGDPSFNDFVEKVSINPSYPGLIHDPYGGILLKNCGYLNTPAYISALRKWFVAEGCFVTDVFNDTFLTFDQEGIMYKNIKAKAVLFCQGIGTIKNRLFNWLPIRPLKGETLTIQAAINGKTIFNRGVYIVPGSTENTWRIGATYEFEEVEAGCTEKARQELEGKLRSLLAVPYRVIDQGWGIRPATHDRKPVIGSHPKWNQAIIFNGFGTKGVSLTPYFSEVLVNWLENNGSLDKDVDISRYKSLYWRTP